MAGFSFGAAPAAPAAGASLFGQQPGAAPSFSFSTPASNAGASTSTPAFSFGAPAQAPATSAPFSFGASAPAAGGTGLFGASKPATAPFSFGQPQQAQAPAAGGFSFGATQPAQPSNTFSFGAPQQQQQQPGLGGFSFGASQPQQQSGMFGQPAQPPAPVGPSPDSIEGQLQAIKTAWHPQSPTCRFQTFFYNVVDPAQVRAYAKPPLASDAAYAKAVRENPDPERMVPALAVGFDDVKKRADAQDRQASMHYAKLQEMSAQLHSIRSALHTLTTSRLSKAETTHAALSARVTRLVSRLHPLTTPQGRSLRSDEEALHAKIEGLQATLAGRGADGGGARLAATLNELWVLAARRRAAASGAEASGAEWAVASEDELANILSVLAQQQQALSHLTSIVEDDLIGVDVIRSGFALPPLSRDP